MQKIEIDKLVKIIFKTMKFKLPQVPTIKLPQFISTLEFGRLFLSYSDARIFDTATWHFLGIYVTLVGCRTLPATEDLN